MITDKRIYEVLHQHGIHHQTPEMFEAITALLFEAGSEPPKPIGYESFGDGNCSLTHTPDGLLLIHFANKTVEFQLPPDVRLYRSANE